MLDRRTFLQFVGMVFASVPKFVIGEARSPRSPAKAAREAWNLLIDGGLDRLVEWLEPGEAREYRRLVTACLLQAESDDESRELLAAFDVKSAEELRGLDDELFFRRFWQAALRQNPEMAQAAQRLRFSVAGTIREEPDIYHVIYELDSDDPDDVFLLRPTLISLQWLSGRWIVLPKQTFLGMNRMVRVKNWDDVDLTPRATRVELVNQWNRRRSVYAVVRYQSVVGKMIVRGTLLMIIERLHGDLYEAAKSGDRERFQKAIVECFDLGGSEE